MITMDLMKMVGNVRNFHFHRFSHTELRPVIELYHLILIPEYQLFVALDFELGDEL